MNVLTKCSTTMARIVLDILHTFNKPSLYFMTVKDTTELFNCIRAQQK